MRRLRPATYLLVLWVSLFTACERPGPRALLDGERLIREGKYSEAIAKLQTATQLLRTNAIAWDYLGLAYQYGGKPDAALAAYQQAVTLDRNSAPMRFNLGTLHLEQNRVNEAINELTTATVLDASSIPAWVNLGKAQLRARRIDDAERSFATALRADPKNVDALNYEGVVNLHRRKARDAMAYFSEALKLQPDYSPAVLNQAVLFQYYIVNKTNALAKYKEYLAMKPDAAGTAAANEAVRVLEAELHPKPVAVVTTNTPPVVTNRVVATITNAPPAPRATNTIQVVSITNQVRSPGFSQQSAEPTNAPPAKAGTTNLVAAIKTNTPPPAPKTNVVAIAPPPVTNAPPKAVEPPVEKKEEPPKPLEVVNVDEDSKFAVAKDIAPPKLAPPVTVASKPAEPTPKKETNAAAVAEPAPLIRPARREEKEKEKSSLLKKANPLNWFKRGKDDEPVQEKVVAKKVETPEAKPSSVKELPEAPKEPEVKPEPVFARYPYQKAPLPAAGNRAAAEAPFNEAVDAHQANKLGKAMDGYRAALRLDPRFFEAHLNLGIAAAQASDLSLALASFEDAVRLNPKSTEARYQFAMALRRANYPQDAVNELKAVVEDAPNEARAYLALGNLYAQVLNNPAAAATNYRHVLDLAPQHPQGPQIRDWLAQH